MSAEVADSKIDHDCFEVVPADDEISCLRVFVHDTFVGGQEDDIDCIVADGLPGFFRAVVGDVLEGEAVDAFEENCGVGGVFGFLEWSFLPSLAMIVD